MQTTWVGAVGIVLLGLSLAPSASAGEPTKRVTVSGTRGVLQVYRDAWVDLCQAPCETVLTGADTELTLGLRTRAGVRTIGSRPGEDVAVDVTDHRSLRTGLGATAVVAGVGALSLFVIAFVTVAKDFSFNVGCDDFTGTPDAASYPNGKTCSSPSHPQARTEALVGLGLAATSAAFAIATLATPAFTVHVTPTIAPTSHGATARLVEITF